jgi:drug/metabolite transporter (DMT)-like permease
MVLASALLHAFWNAWAKKASSPAVFLGLLAISQSIVGAVGLAFVDWSELPDALWPVLGASACVHVAYQLFLGAAYQRGDLSVVYPISRSTPALVALVAVPLLDDPVTPLGGLGIGVVVIGMWLVQTSGVLRWSALSGPGTGYAVLTLLATAGYSILDKRAMVVLAAAEPWSGPLPVALCYFGLLQIAHTIPYAPLVLLRARPVDVRTVLRSSPALLIVGSFASLASYALILAALQTASVSYVTAVRQCSVLFAAGLGVVLLGERPSRARLLGTVLIVAGVVGIAIGG